MLSGSSNDEMCFCCAAKLKAVKEELQAQMLEDEQCAEDTSKQVSWFHILSGLSKSSSVRHDVIPKQHFHVNII